jgi:hypothetical protein
VCGTKNFSSVRLYSAPHSHRTIVVILRICARDYPFSSTEVCHNQTGFVREMKDGQESAVRTAAGKMPRLTDFLPANEEAWLNAISDYTRAFFTEAGDV